MTKMTVIANEQRIHAHTEGGIAEDGLRMVQGHQVVIFDVSGIIEWHCV